MEKHVTNGNDPVNVMPTEIHTGLTKRELFAAMAMQGLLAQKEQISRQAFITAVQCADNLIEELNK